MFGRNGPSDRLIKQFDEIKALYELSEAEIQCLLQMSTLIHLLGFSPELTIKLLRALTAFYEVSHDELYRQGQKEKK